MAGSAFYYYLAPYILWSEYLKKAACLFAGLGHLQPLLLATTNANYLLDRFCMERCCSSEYISRIVTSTIFMEVIAIIVVRIVLYGALRDHSSQSSATQLVKHTRKEEEIRDSVSITILWMIFLGYLQILLVFLSGGKKGHMHWFYASLLIQHFLNSLIAGSIGFWDVGLALWYLVTLPMAPIVIFFYQMIIHSWIRNNGPRDIEYIVVEYQIILALILSCIATIFWTFGYVIPHIPINATQLNLATGSPTSSTPGNITAHSSKPVALKVYSIDGSGTTATATIESTGADVKVKVHSITVTVQGAPNPVIVYPKGYLTNANSGWSAKVTAQYEANSKVTIKIENTKGGTPLYEEEVKVTKASGITKMYLALEYNGNITVKDATNGDGQADPAIVKGYACYPKYAPRNCYYISGISVASLWRSTWDGGKCFYAECYYNGTGGDNPALLKLYVLGNTLTTKYYGNDGSQWKIIKTDADFNKYVDILQRTGELTGLTTAGTPATDQSDTQNTEFTKVLLEMWTWEFWEWPWKKHSPTWLPLLMQGLSVGAVGSIFPNLIPKTLTCPKTTRNLSVINMFLVTVPHIFNVMLGDMDLLEWIGTGDDWKIYKGWPCSLLLYMFYILAILFAIFNIHYPEWALSSFLRNNTWMVFLMILFTDVLNESFNAISRAGICSQKAAVGGKKNHPCLHNKIHCLMNLTYIPFWMTTTPMMKDL